MDHRDPRDLLLAIGRVRNCRCIENHLFGSPVVDMEGRLLGQGCVVPDR